MPRQRLPLDTDSTSSLLEDSPTEEAPRARPQAPAPPPDEPDGIGLPPDDPKRRKGRRKSLPIPLRILKWLGVTLFTLLTLGLGGIAWWMAGSRRGFIRWTGRFGVAFGVTAILAACGAAYFAYTKYTTWTQDLPSVEEIAEYYPPTVTVIYDSKGQRLAELHDPDPDEAGGRRYVVPIGCPEEGEASPAGEEPGECIPQVVQDAFIAAEDANFMIHGGVDYEGILRAVVRNAMQGKKAQGASTITMQVARNMPALNLTREKSYRRKVREVVLAQRMEEAFDKDYILFLYLNQIYLGSQSYGVEAASRVYFNKHVGDLTLAEAAILAGLPQRPHDYSPHVNWEAARSRQEYVLGQMRNKGFVDKDEYDQAMEERVLVVKTENDFLKQAPYFAEEVRQYLEKTYGDEKVYEDGLEVYTTCDLDLQKVAQKAVREHVLWADKRRGWRGVKSHIEPDEIQAWRDSQDLAFREEMSKQQIWVAAADKAPGFDPVPESWEMQDPLSVEHPADKTVYEAVVLEVEKTWAKVGTGRYEALIPVEWAWWARSPDPEKSWRSTYQQQNDLTNVLEPGDIIEIRLRSTEEEFRLEPHRRVDNGRISPGFSDKHIAELQEFGLPFAELHQESALQGAMISYRLEDGAIQAMVGGVDYEKSQFNRATQARRQVGSTIKPIVYTAAINEGYYHAASRVLDQAISIPTTLGQYWRPGNYGEEYEGWLTMRQALQKSKNVCTVQILQKTGVDAVFDLAGPRLRIGYDSPTCLKTHITLEETCPGTTSPSTLEGMQWCEVCDPTSCPLARVQDSPDFQCIDTPQIIAGNEFCHSCDINLRLCSRLPIPPDFEQEYAFSQEALDECIDAHIDYSFFYYDGQTSQELPFEFTNTPRKVPAWYESTYRGEGDRDPEFLHEATLKIYELNDYGGYQNKIWEEEIPDLLALAGKYSRTWSGQMLLPDGTTGLAPAGTYKYIISGKIDHHPRELWLDKYGSEGDSPADLAKHKYEPVTASARTKEVVRCRECDLSMGLGSSALTMWDLAQGYSAFPTGGHRVTPHYIAKIVDGDEHGTVIESWEPPEDGWPQVVDEEVAGLGHWLVYQVAHGGTGHQAGKLANSNSRGTIGIAGKTGTTNDFNDAWFVGYNPELITAAWVGHDENERLGVSSTGGRTAMPIWMEYMREAAPRITKDDLPEGAELPPDARFEVWDELQRSPARFKWHPINEDKASYNFGTISEEGREMPFKKKSGTEIWNMPGKAQEVTVIEEEMDW